MHFNRRQFIKLSGVSGLGIVTGMPSFAKIFEGIGIEQNFIPVCGIRPTQDSIGERGIHLRWSLLPAKGIPDLISIYRKKSQTVRDPRDSSRDELCKANDWEKIGEINNKIEIFEAADSRLIFKRIPAAGSYNYYLPAQGSPERNSKLEAYKKNAKYYWGILKALRNPTTEYFINPEDPEHIESVPVDKLLLKNKNNSTEKINAWNLLMLGSADPNIARMLGLYFVDMNAQTGSAFDYKIEAAYDKTHELVCGIIQQVGNEFSEKPALLGSLVCTQTDKTWWEFDERYFRNGHYGKVRLLWPQAENISADDVRQRFTEPVLYGLKINNSKYKLIAPQPDAEDRLYFVDQRASVDINATHYSLLGIDIFGQISNMLTASCNLKDKDIPSPPSRLSFIDSGTSVKLSFEYGASQYLGAPDTKSFNIYSKNDSVFTSHRVRYKLLNQDERNEKGNRIIKLEVLDFTLNSNFNKIRFIEDLQGKRARAVLRRIFKIHSIVSPNVLSFYCSSEYTPLANGFISISQDPYKKSTGWTRTHSIDCKSPAFFQLKDYTHFISNSTDGNHFAGNSVVSEKAFSCQAKKIVHKKYGVEKDLFDNAQHPTGDFTEIYIDRRLLVADVFTNGKVKIGANEYPIIHQSAGIAFRKITALSTGYGQASTPAFAKIIIAGHVDVDTSAQAGLLKLYPQVKENAEPNSNKLHDWVILRFQSTTNALPVKTVGEVLLKGIRQNTIAEDTPVIARTGSDFYRTANNIELLVFLDKKIKVLYTPAPALFFGAYEVNITPHIAVLGLAPSEAHRSIYFAAETIDKTTPSKVSALSGIAQFIKIRDKHKPATPPTPYPCGNVNAAEAFLKPPNKEGRSIFCIEWSASPGLRYEVGRALDKTIIAVHKDMWLKGIPNISPPVPVASDTNGGKPFQSSSIHPTTGLIDATAIAGLAASISPEKFKGGRCIQGNRYYEIVQCSIVDSDLKLILRPMLKAGLQNNLGEWISPVTNNTFKLESMADYTRVLNNSAALRTMADLCPSAFSLVTGSALRNTGNFLDDVPGTGSSRFFYRVRAVDASENRSDWSQASVPVWQLDTTPPDAPLMTYIEGLEQAAFMKWRNEEDKKITGYHLYRADKKVDPKNPADYSGEKLIATIKKSAAGNNEVTASFARLRHRYNQIQVPVHDLSLKYVGTTGHRISAVYKVNDNGVPDKSVNYFIAAVTSMQGQVIRNLPPAIRNNVAVVVVLNSTVENEEIVLYKNELTNLITQNDQITIPQIANVRADNPIKGIFKLEEYSFGSTVSDQTAQNYFIIHASEYLREKQLLRNFYPGLQQNQAVAIETKNIRTTNLVTTDRSEYEFTDDLQQHLTLDLFYNYRLEAIKTVSMGDISVMILSRKSQDKLVQIKMNTPPPVPEIVSVEWWDWERDTVLRPDTTQIGVKIVLQPFPLIYTLKCYISNTEVGPYAEVVESYIRKTIGNNYVTDILISDMVKSERLIKLAVTDQWKKVNSIIKIIKNE